MAASLASYGIIGNYIQTPEATMQAVRPGGGDYTYANTGSGTPPILFSQSVLTSAYATMNTSTGFFTVNNTGLYLINSTVQTDNGGYTSATLVLNIGGISSYAGSVGTANGFITLPGATPYFSYSLTAIIALTAGAVGNIGFFPHQVGNSTVVRGYQFGTILQVTYLGTS